MMTGKGQKENNTHSKIDPMLSDSLGHCLVTGAAGFLGTALVKSLLDHGCRIRALIHKTSPDISHDRLEYVQGDVRSTDDMQNVCKGIETVFHTAAVISLMGGKSATESYCKPAYDVNVKGTKNLLDACRKQKVIRLIYTSSVDVCFNGTPNPDMDENTPYATQAKSIYAETKITSESMVLKSNGKDGLLTCAIRPDGIYGPGKNMMLDRFVSELSSGKLVAAVGSSSALQDNSYIDNLVHGEILAAQHLIPDEPACGKAYFITDNSPMNAFEFFRPLIEGLGYPFPKFRIPRGALMPILKTWEKLHFLFGIKPPMMSPHELDKIGVTHFASIKDATRDLGYEPIKTVDQAMAECLPYCKKLVQGGA